MAAAHSDSGVRRRSALRRLALGTGLASAGLAAGGTGGALLVSDAAGSQSAAGLPFGFVVTGSAVGAVLISWATTHIGRHTALAVGYLAGVLGAMVVIAGGIAGSVPLILAGSLLLGPANASVFLSRYAGADLAAEEDRGRNLGLILFATAAGAVLAPNLLGPADSVSATFGLPRYSGLYLVAMAAFGISAAMLIHNRQVRGADPHPIAARTLGSIDAGPERLPVVRPAVGLVVLAAANMSMVGIMAVVPVHLDGHGHHLASIGIVISVHAAAMFAPAPLTGWLCDRIGPERVAVAGGAVLLGAGGWAAIADDGHLWLTTGSLLALGLGWNLAVVAGSTMLTATLQALHRPRMEAAGEVTMGAAAAIGASGAGLLAATRGWSTMVASGGIVGAVALIAGLSNPDARQADTSNVPQPGDDPRRDEVAGLSTNVAVGSCPVR